MRRIVLTLVLAAAVVIAATATLGATTSTQQDTATLGATANLPVQESTLRIRQVVDSSPPGYTEGAVSFLRVKDASGKVVARKRVQWRGARLIVTLPSDTYRIVSFLRPCSGDCDRLDPPTDRCSRRIELLPHENETVRVRVKVVPQESCGIRFRR